MQRTTTVFEMTAEQMAFKGVYPDTVRYMGVPYTRVFVLMDREGDFAGSVYESDTPSRYQLWVLEED